VLIARRELVWDAPGTAQALAAVLPGLDAAALSARLTERDRGVVYVRRGLTLAQAEAALDLGLAYKTSHLTQHRSQHHPR
jgi:DNA-directed RNA polymerase specialized sigma24 family protein